MSNSKRGAGQSRTPLTGLVLGLVAGCVLLAAYGIALLSVDAVSPKALAAVWLAALPVLGAFGGAGYGIGRVLGRRSMNAEGASDA